MIILSVFEGTRMVSLHNQFVATYLGALEHKRAVAGKLDAENKITQAVELRNLIANMAHDLKSPIQAFTNSLEHLRDTITSTFGAIAGSAVVAQILDEMRASASQGPVAVSSGPSMLSVEDEEKRQEFMTCMQVLEDMAATSQFMTMMINRAIDYSKASCGIDLMPVYRNINVVDAIEWSIRCVRSLQDNIPIILQPLPPEMVRTCITDGQWLKENLLCVLSNAMKFSYSGTVEIAISFVEEKRRLPVRRQSDGRPDETTSTPAFPLMRKMVRYQVTDCGIGISPEMQERVFQPLTRSSTDRHSGGAGLGLYSLSKRVEALGGNFGIGPRPDGREGTVCWFSEPYRPAFISREEELRVFALKKSKQQQGDGDSWRSPSSSPMASAAGGIDSGRSGGGAAAGATAAGTSKKQVGVGPSPLIAEPKTAAGGMDIETTEVGASTAVSNGSPIRTRTISHHSQLGEIQHSAKTGGSKEISFTAPASSSCEPTSTNAASSKNAVGLERSVGSSKKGEDVDPPPAVVAEGKDSDRGIIKPTGSTSSKGGGGGGGSERKPTTLAAAALRISAADQVRAATPTKLPEDVKAGAPAAADVQSPSFTAAALKSNNGRVPPLKVLVVDDSMTILRTMVRTLQKGKHVVETAQNGELALRMLKERRFDAVLMDIQMYVCCSSASREVWFWTLHILMMSIYFDDRICVTATVFFCAPLYFNCS
jgi:signal transduction histidine kinase